MFTGDTRQHVFNSNASSAMSPGSIDRVFPVRSAVSIDPAATPGPRYESNDGFPGMNLSMNSTIAERRQMAQKHSETLRHPSVLIRRQKIINIRNVK